MLSEEQRKTIEGRLLRMREDALDAIGHFDENNQDMHERAGEMSLYRFHPADLGSEMEEREKEFLLASQEGRRLYEIDPRPGGHGAGPAAVPLRLVPAEGERHAGRSPRDA